MKKWLSPGNNIDRPRSCSDKSLMLVDSVLFCRNWIPLLFSAFAISFSHRDDFLVAFTSCHWSSQTSLTIQLNWQLIPLVGSTSCGASVGERERETKNNFLFRFNPPLPLSATTWTFHSMFQLDDAACSPCISERTGCCPPPDAVARATGNVSISLSRNFCSAPSSCCWWSQLITTTTLVRVNSISVVEGQVSRWRDCVCAEPYSRNRMETGRQTKATHHRQLGSQFSGSWCNSIKGPWPESTDGRERNDAMNHQTITSDWLYQLGFCLKQ